ncbi:MAG: hypothetical protein U1E45_17750 [Geminicoccaceae bacterium]
MIERRRVCLAYSPGGHRAELDRALQGIEFTDCFHVTFASGREPAGPRTYFIEHPRRSLRRTLRAFTDAWRVLRRERPEVVISTGADVAVPVVLVAAAMGCTTVFVETGGTIDASLSGRLTYPFVDLFIIQWPEKLAAFPRAVLADGLLL